MRSISSINYPDTSWANETDLGEYLMLQDEHGRVAAALIAIVLDRVRNSTVPPAVVTHPASLHHRSKVHARRQPTATLRGVEIPRGHNHICAMQPTN